MENRFVAKQLPPRPNLDHLRGQAKSLLAAIAAGDADAIATIQKHLPSAKQMSPAQIRQAPLRLADAQSAVARKTGFASWPQLARHVDQLRNLEGTWEFARLEVDGNTIPPAALTQSRISIDGDRFRTDSPEATYEGIFNIDVEAEPHQIDIEFVEGPEAGNWNYGIFRLDRDQLEICLDMSGKSRPGEFRTTEGSGHAYETLKRSSRARPEKVTGGTPSQKTKPTTSAPSQGPAGFDYVDSPLMTRLQGDWAAVKIVRDGQELPAMMLGTGLRKAIKNEVKISFGGQVMIQALVRLDESTDPISVDYYNTCGIAAGTVQMGIMKWIGDEACFCMAALGQPRPNDFSSLPGSGRTLSQWRLK